MLAHTFEDVVANIRRAIDKGRPAEALSNVFDEMHSVLHRGGLGSEMTSSPALDQLAVEAGRLGIQPKGRVRPGVVAIVVSDLQVGAQRWREVLNLLSIDPGKRFIVLTTAHCTLVEIPGPLPETAFEVVSAPDELPYQRLVWLQKRLAELRPTRTYLLARPLDGIAVAACQPELVGQLLYIHQRGERPALGVHLENALHIDPDAAGFQKCRCRGIQNVYLPRLGRCHAGKIVAPRNVKRLTTASAGPDFASDDIAPLSRLDLVDMVVRALVTTGGTHVHFGALSDWILARIERRLLNAGISPDAFLYRPDCAVAAGGTEIDLFLGSVPCASAWSIVDAMAAGLPLLLFDPTLPPVYSDVSRAYPGVPTWRTLDELTAQLKNYDFATRTEHSRRAAKHHARSHNLATVRRAVSAVIAGKAARPPRPVIDRSDPLAIAHDENLRQFPRGHHDADLLPPGIELEEQGVDLTSSGSLFMGEGGPWRCCVDRVFAGYGWIEIWGWAVGEEGVEAIEISQDYTVPLRSPLTIDRPDVREAFMCFDPPETCGFQIRIPHPRGIRNAWRAELRLILDDDIVARFELHFERPKEFF